MGTPCALHPPDTENGTFELALRFDPDDLIGAEAGIYECIWECSLNWGDFGDIFPDDQPITLRMVIPQVTRSYSVTVTNNGLGRRTRILIMRSVSYAPNAKLPGLPYVVCADAFPSVICTVFSVYLFPDSTWNVTSTVSPAA